MNEQEKIIYDNFLTLLEILKTNKSKKIVNHFLNWMVREWM